jgi:hypothetical protein
MDWLTVDDSFPGSFRLCKAIYLPEYNREIDEIRCDAKGWGPVAIGWQADGDIFGTPSIPYLNSLHEYNIVVDAAPYFYITYNRFIDTQTATPFASPEMSEQAWLEHPETVAPTLAHLFKLMIEWDYVFHNPFNNNEISAQMSHQALSILGITNEIKNSLVENCPDMPVARYLQDDPDAKSIPDSAIVSGDVENYLNSIINDFKYRGYDESLWTRVIEYSEHSS